MKQILIMPEISPLVGRMLRKLTSCQETDILFSEGKPAHTFDQLAMIRNRQPALVITKNWLVAEEVCLHTDNSKVILMLTQPGETWDKLWRAFFDLDAFWVSTQKVMIIK